MNQFFTSFVGFTLFHLFDLKVQRQRNKGQRSLFYPLLYFFIRARPRVRRKIQRSCGGKVPRKQFASKAARKSPTICGPATGTPRAVELRKPTYIATLSLREIPMIDPERPSKCNRCKMVFPPNADFEEIYGHLITCSRPPGPPGPPPQISYQCVWCGEGNSSEFRSFHLLREHVLAFHEDRSPHTHKQSWQGGSDQKMCHLYFCQCDTFIDEWDVLIKHYREMHPNLTPPPQ